MRTFRARISSAWAVIPALVLLASIVALPVLATPRPASAGETPSARFLRLVNEALERGEITEEAALLNRFAYVFEPGSVEPRFRVENPTPLRCATDLVRDYLAARDRVSPQTAARIEGWLAASDPASPGALAAPIFDSPGGYFRLTYEISGPNAVPAADLDPVNGVPDFVEWIATYCDSSWSRVIDGLGFTPPLLGAGGRYAISFQAQGSYGYTTTSGGGTRIVLHNTFLGFPPDDDPEGSQKGAAKATVAHEFKHASQYQGSFWSEGGWVELDATWVEDAVYDSTNDYYNFIDSGNNIVSPASSIDAGGSGSYEDCIWQRYMSETFGDQIIVDLWERRKLNQSEAMKTSYNMILLTRGSSYLAAFEEFLGECYLSGARSGGALDRFEQFDESPRYPTAGLQGTGSALPWGASGSVSHSAAHFYLVDNPGTFQGAPRITFDGASGTPLRLRLIFHRSDGNREIETIALDANGDANVRLSHSWPDIDSLAVLVLNPRRNAAGGDAYAVALSEEVVTAVGDPRGPGAFPEIGAAASGSARFALEQNVPNPAPGATRFRFSLPAAAEARLEIFDLAGRVVATLARGPLAAGPHEVAWNGIGAGGEPVPPGVYAYRLLSGKSAETRKLLLVR